MLTIFELLLVFCFFFTFWGEFKKRFNLELKELDSSINNKIITKYTFELFK